MATRSRVCPSCGALNGASDEKCTRCGRWLPGTLVGSLRSQLEGVRRVEVPATKLFLGLCLGTFALMTVLNGGRLPLGLNDGFPLSIVARFGGIVTGFFAGEPFRVVSAIFVHWSVLHCVLNCLALGSIGGVVERRLGTARFALLFLATGTLGFCASRWWHSDELVFATAGASGSIFGLIGADVGRLFSRRDPSARRTLVNQLIYAGLLAIAFRADNAAHLGGFASGIALGFLFDKERAPRRHDVLAGVAAALCVAAAVLTLVLATRSPVWRQIAAQEQSEA